MADLSGRCFCGAVKWRTSSPVLWAGICHCDSCRRATSSPMTAFFGVRRSAVSWTGTLSAVQSAEGRVQRQFCPGCGAHMTYQSDNWPDEAHLYAASLDDPSLVRPEAHFHWRERLSWIAISDDLPKFPGSADETEALS